jgi:hypothetical protein
LNNLQDVLRNWAGIRDFELGRGNCGTKLNGYMHTLNKLISSKNVLFVFDESAPGVGSSAILGGDPGSPGQTVDQFFAAHPDSYGHTYYRYNTDARGNRTTTVADIYLRTGVFPSQTGSGGETGADQGTLFFHEMLHAALDRSDDEIVSLFNIDRTGKTSSKAISDWLDAGCPDAPKKQP